MYLRINSPNVVRECFDGEVVVVNLERGTYYSLEKTAAKIWQLFEQGLDVNQVLETLARNYKVEVDQLRPSVARFIEELCQEALVVKETQAIAVEANTSSALLVDSPQAFCEPVIRKYTDMQDLLLLDPIHEVDQAGWPTAKPVSEM